MRPALTVSQPRPGYNAGPLTTIRVGIADAYSAASKRTRFRSRRDGDVKAANRGRNWLIWPRQTGDGIYTIALTTPINDVTNVHLYAAVSDNQGNITRVNQEFSVDPNGVPGATPTFTPLPSYHPHYSWRHAAPNCNGDTPRHADLCAYCAIGRWGCPALSTGGGALSPSGRKSVYHQTVAQ